MKIKIFVYFSIVLQWTQWNSWKNWCSRKVLSDDDITFQLLGHKRKHTHTHTHSYIWNAQKTRIPFVYIFYIRTYLADMCAGVCNVHFLLIFVWVRKWDLSLELVSVGQKVFRPSTTATTLTYGTKKTFLKTDEKRPFIQLKGPFLQANTYIYVYMHIVKRNYTRTIYMAST